MVFAFLFGLSMDYEVFIVSRVREEHERGLPLAGRRGGCCSHWQACYQHGHRARTFAALAASPPVSLKMFRHELLQAF